MGAAPGWGRGPALWMPGEFALAPCQAASEAPISGRGMKFSTAFLDEIRARVPVSQVVGARVKLQEGRPRMARAVAVQRGEDAVVLRQ